MERELKRRRWIVHKKIQRWNEKDIATALRISVRTVRAWGKKRLKECIPKQVDSKLTEDDL